jgi:hypothetical protein
MELLDTSSSILNFDDCNDLSNNYKETLVQVLSVSPFFLSYS